MKYKRNIVEKFKYPTVGKILIRIPFYLKSPVIIGCGESANSDLDIIRETDWKGKNDRYVLPATSIVGVFRAYLEHTNINDINPQLRDLLFGDDGDKVGQSALACDDVYIDSDSAKISIRDSVKILTERNTAKDQGLFSYEVLETKEKLELFCEITQRNLLNFDENKEDPLNIKENECQSIFRTLIKGMRDGGIRLGAKTNKGFGKLRADWDDAQIAVLSFTKEEDLQAWIDRSWTWKSFTKTIEPYTVTKKQFTISGYFEIKNSLLIKSYDFDPKMPDASSISNGFQQKIIPGTSIMGAIRHRALRILNTLGWQDAQERIDDLFGYVLEKKTNTEKDMFKVPAKRGRVRVEETIITNPIDDQVQTRIRIDRFTGGTVEGALFDVMPVFAKEDETQLKIDISLKINENWEAALLLAVLKDIWQGELQIGGEKNIGRGTLVPCMSSEPDEDYAVCISWQDGIVELKVDEDGNPDFDSADRGKLDQFEIKRDNGGQD